MVTKKKKKKRKKTKMNSMQDFNGEREKGRE